MKEFHGDSLDFPRFWNQFTNLVDKRSDLDDVTKYTYLSEACKGSAQNIFMSYRGEPSDYQDALIALKKAYGDNDQIRRTLIRRFFNLNSPKYAKEDIFNFRLELENLVKMIGHDTKIDLQYVLSELIYLKLPDEVTKFLFNYHKSNYFNLDQIDAGLGELHNFLKQEKVSKSSKP